MLGGIPVFSWEIARGLSHLGLDVQVLTYAELLKKAPEGFRVENFRENRLRGKARRIALLQPLRRIIKNWEPQLIFLDSIHPYGFIVERLCSLYKIPYAVATHGLEI